MTARRRRGGGITPGWSLPALCAALATLAACAKIVGIVDTDVTRGPDGGPLDASTAPSKGEAGGSDDGPIAADGEVDAAALGEAGPGDDAGPGPGSLDASADADASSTQSNADGGCTSGATRCGASGRESCASGQWAASPCAVNQPTCSAAGQCTVRGPTMVQVGGAFYIDSTEVTVAQYQQFLADKGSDTSGQPSVCAWNKTYYDSTVALNPAQFPMTNVDWCDAVAFCTWAGKHLCGKIGGGPVASVDALTATKSQWFLACGGPGGASHPNSNSTCNSSFGNGSLAAVATYKGCEGYYPGVFDLEGNAAEWVDSCDSTDAGATDTCHLLGGSYIDETSYCDESFDEPRNETANPFGFRCCGG